MCMYSKAWPSSPAFECSFTNNLFGYKSQCLLVHAPRRSDQPQLPSFATWSVAVQASEESKVSCNANYRLNAPNPMHHSFSSRSTVCLEGIG